MEKGLRVAMELETPGYTRPLGGLGSSVCIPRHRSVSPTNRQLESSSSSSALRDGPPLRLQPRPLGVIKDDNFINCMSAGAARDAPPLVAYHRSAAPARPGNDIFTQPSILQQDCISTNFHFTVGFLIRKTMGKPPGEQGDTMGMPRGD